ncbi:MAG: hypothetical protein AAF639_18700 [Chloroflexota bacterium]
MAYSDFKTIGAIRDKFSVTVSSNTSFLFQIEEVKPNPHFYENLQDSIKLAININTEKARSEFLIAPVLQQARNLVDRQVSLFSGVEFTVDNEAGLNGYCDFILSRSTDLSFISSPVVCMVEAKNQDMTAAYPQCMAEMIAAQQFNHAQSNEIDTIWGVVTTGSIWRFLRLIDTHIEQDISEYHINQVGKILGILQYILKA